MPGSATGGVQSTTTAFSVGICAATAGRRRHRRRRAARRPAPMANPAAPIATGHESHRSRVGSIATPVGHGRGLRRLGGGDGSRAAGLSPRSVRLLRGRPAGVCRLGASPASARHGGAPGFWHLDAAASGFCPGAHGLACAGLRLLNRRDRLQLLGASVDRRTSRGRLAPGALVGAGAGACRCLRLRQAAAARQSFRRRARSSAGRGSAA